VKGGLIDIVHTMFDEVLIWMMWTSFGGRAAVCGTAVAADFYRPKLLVTAAVLNATAGTLWTIVGHVVLGPVPALG
jgi:hypothetical protein